MATCLYDPGGSVLDLSVILTAAIDRTDCQADCVRLNKPTTVLGNSASDPNAAAKILLMNDRVLSKWGRFQNYRKYPCSKTSFHSLALLHCSVLYLRLNLGLHNLGACKASAQSEDDRGTAKHSEAGEHEERQAFSLQDMLWLLLSCHIVLWVQPSTDISPKLLSWLTGLQVSELHYQVLEQICGLLTHNVPQLCTKLT